MARPVIWAAAGVVLVLVAVITVIAVVSSGSGHAGASQPDTFCADTDWLFSAGNLFDETYASVEQQGQPITPTNLDAGFAYGGGVRASYDYYVSAGQLPAGITTELRRVFAAIADLYDRQLDSSQPGAAWATKTLHSCGAAGP